MTELEGSVSQRWKGSRIVLISLGTGVTGVLPLLAYIAFGPKNGNPIGLGLLALLMVAIATIGVLVGAIKLLIEIFTREKH